MDRYIGDGKETRIIRGAQLESVMVRRSWRELAEQDFENLMQTWLHDYDMEGGER